MFDNHITSSLLSQPTEKQQTTVNSNNLPSPLNSSCTRNISHIVGYNHHCHQSSSSLSSIYNNNNLNNGSNISALPSITKQIASVNISNKKITVKQTQELQQQSFQLSLNYKLQSTNSRIRSPCKYTPSPNTTFYTRQQSSRPYPPVNNQQQKQQPQTSSLVLMDSTVPSSPRLLNGVVPCSSPTTDVISKMSNIDIDYNSPPTTPPNINTSPLVCPGAPKKKSPTFVQPRIGIAPRVLFPTSFNDHTDTLISIPLYIPATNLVSSCNYSDQTDVPSSPIPSPTTLIFD